VGSSFLKRIPVLRPSTMRTMCKVSVTLSLTERNSDDGWFDDSP
jgi:hypothetical protein